MEQIPLEWDRKQCGIYCIKNKVSGKIYIGSSKNCYHRVRSQHFDKLQRREHHNPHLQASWNKYGKSSFEGFCVEICEINVLKVREQQWIEKTNCLNPKVGYNINPYADRTELTPEQCKKISLSKMGKPRSAETRRKISEAQRGRKQSNELIQKRMDARKGYRHSEETKEKIRAQKGWKHTEESKLKMRQAKRKGS